MLFYEDLIKEVEKNQDIKVMQTEKFRLENLKLLTALCIALPLIVVSLFYIYLFINERNFFYLAVGLILLYIGAKQVKNICTYSLKIDTDNKKIIYQKLVIEIDTIKSATLKEMNIKKRLVPVIDCITTDKREIIIPLYMNNKVRFINILQLLLKDKFIIKK